MKGKTALLLAVATWLVFLAGKSLLTNDAVRDRPEHFPTDVIFSAYREGSLGSILLKLYQDQHFEFTWSGTRAVAKGLYAFHSDTLVLTATKGTRIIKGARQMRFVVDNGMLVELPNVTGIKFLGITTDQLHKGQ
ncbi:hypothetical protein [Hymenobacter lucidus]|uniref:Uncharacterized protein n=1 Tax=Hymenobacter lucidus TaxID=2880930 RepID=A0ABS8AJM3_9BACT|nr:hypothetical protein [Hymenobacter lucidus]MCB2406410.1 hypothetical protein [Hymenobacter lucidus]